MVTNTKNLLLLVRKLDNILDDLYETLFVGMCLPIVFTNSTLLASISIPYLHVTMHVSKIGTIDKHGVQDFRKFKELFCSMFHIFSFPPYCMYLFLFISSIPQAQTLTKIDYKFLLSFSVLSKLLLEHFVLENMHVFIYLNVFTFFKSFCSAFNILSIYAYTKKSVFFRYTQ